MAYLWCLVVVSVAAIAAPSLAANTMKRELAELLNAMAKELGHTPALASESKTDPELPQSNPASKDGDEEDDFTNVITGQVGQRIIDREYHVGPTLDEVVASSSAANKEDPILPEPGPASKGQRIIDREYHSGPTLEEIVARENEEDFTNTIPGKIGYKEVSNMTREDAEQHLRESTAGIDRMDYSWTVDKALEEMRRERGEEFYRQFRRETRQKKDKPTFYNCAFCDKDCEKKAAGYGTLKGLEARIQEAFADIGIEAKTGLVMKPGKRVPFSIYLKGKLSDRGTKDMGRVADNFWKYKNFYLKAQGAGCDSLVLAVDDDDPLYVYVPNAIGVGGMLQMCKESYTVCQVNEVASISASIIIHEIGHLFGMYHDSGKRESSYVNQALLNYLSDKGAALKEHCDKDDSGCASGKGNCIMNAVAKGRKKFSQCSTAYLHAYFDMAEQFGDYYDKSCVTGA